MNRQRQWRWRIVGKGAGMAFVVPAEGADRLVAVFAILLCLREFCLMGKVRLRTDTEPSIQSLAVAVAQQRAPADSDVEQSPLWSSSSLGGAERCAELVAGLVRTLMLEVAERWSRPPVFLSVKSPVFPWAVNHATWLYNRYADTANGKTAFARLQVREYQQPIMAFGSPSPVRFPHALDQGKFEPRWEQGVCLGRHPTSDEHLAGAAGGMVC